LIEAVHGEEGHEIPEPIQHAQLEAEGEAHAQAGVARGNVVAVNMGYLEGCHGAVASDRQFPTRLGDPQVTLVLARRACTGLIPWADHENPEAAWSLSEVSASKRRFECKLPEQATDEIRKWSKQWPEWRRELYSVCVVEPDGKVGTDLLYDETFGLRFRFPT